MTRPSDHNPLPDQARKAIFTNMAIASLLTLAVTLFYWWVKFDGNITGFFRIGDVLPLSPYLDPAQTRIYPDQLGYDGHFFLTIGLDPGLINPDSVAALDRPPLSLPTHSVSAAGLPAGPGQENLASLCPGGHQYGLHYRPHRPDQLGL